MLEKKIFFPLQIKLEPTKFLQVPSWCSLSNPRKIFSLDCSCLPPTACSRHWSRATSIHTFTNCSRTQKSGGNGFSIDIVNLDTGCSLKIVFFWKILKYSELFPFSVFPRCQCVYTHQAGRTPTLQQNWKSLEKSQSFKEKTQYLMNTL